MTSDQVSQLFLVLGIALVVGIIRYSLYLQDSSNIWAGVVERDIEITKHGDVATAELWIRSVTERVQVDNRSWVPREAESEAVSLSIRLKPKANRNNNNSMNNKLFNNNNISMDFHTDVDTESNSGNSLLLSLHGSRFASVGSASQFLHEAYSTPSRNGIPQKRPYSVMVMTGHVNRDRLFWTDHFGTKSALATDNNSNNDAEQSTTKTNKVEKPFLCDITAYVSFDGDALKKPFEEEGHVWDSISSFITAASTSVIPYLSGAALLREETVLPHGFKTDISNMSGVLSLRVVSQSCPISFALKANSFNFWHSFYFMAEFLFVLWAAFELCRLIVLYHTLSKNHSIQRNFPFSLGLMHAVHRSTITMLFLSKQGDKWFTGVQLRFAMLSLLSHCGFTLMLVFMDNWHERTYTLPEQVPWPFEFRLEVDPTVLPLNSGSSSSSGATTPDSVTESTAANTDTITQSTTTTNNNHTYSTNARTERVNNSNLNAQAQTADLLGAATAAVPELYSSVAPQNSAVNPTYNNYTSTGNNTNSVNINSDTGNFLSEVEAMYGTTGTGASYSLLQKAPLRERVKASCNSGLRSFKEVSQKKLHWVAAHLWVAFYPALVWCHQVWVGGMFHILLMPFFIEWLFLSAISYSPYLLVSIACLLCAFQWRFYKGPSDDIIILADDSTSGNVTMGDGNDANNTNSNNTNNNSTVRSGAASEQDSGYGAQLIVGQRLNSASSRIISLCSYGSVLLGVSIAPVLVTPLWGGKGLLATIQNDPIMWLLLAPFMVIASFIANRTDAQRLSHYYNFFRPFPSCVLKQADSDGCFECSICMELGNCDEDVMCITPCSHVFHGECLQQWAAIRPECPMCRRNVPDVDELADQVKEQIDLKKNAAQNHRNQVAPSDSDPRQLSVTAVNLENHTQHQPEAII